MPELRAATASSRFAPARVLPIAPWRALLWLACLALAAGAAWQSWAERRGGEAQAADAELMLRVAQRWADAQAFATLPTDDAARSARTAPSPVAAALDSARVLALIDHQHELDPALQPAIGAARDAWAAAARQWGERLREPAAAPERTGRLRDSAAAMAQASQRLMQTLRERAEARGTHSGTRPGVMLALASLGLLVLGLRRHRRDEEAPAAAAPAAAVQARPDAEPSPHAMASTDALAPLVDEATLLAHIGHAEAASGTRGAPALLVLQADAPPALLAEIDPGARLDLERQIVRRLHAHLGSGDALALGEPGSERIELLVLVQPARALREAFMMALLDDVADAYTVFDHPVRAPMRLGLRELAGSPPQPGQALHDARLACAHATPGSVLRFTPELGERAEQQRGLAGEIDAALADGTLRPVYRAVVALGAAGAGRLLGWRAGWQWQHAGMGALEDAGVQRIATHAARGAALQGELRRLALRDFARWRSQQRVPQGARIGLPWALAGGPADAAEAIVRRQLAAAQLPAEALEVLLDDAGDETAAADEVLALRALGVRVTLQGLAHDSASLSSLLQLGADGVLIARRFVAQLPGHDAHRLLVQAIVSVAAQHGLATSAEGVDTPQQLEALAALGVAAAQGDAVALALDGAGVDAWLAAAANSLPGDTPEPAAA